MLAGKPLLLNGTQLCINLFLRGDRFPPWRRVHLTMETGAIRWLGMTWMLLFESLPICHHHSHGDPENRELKTPTNQKLALWRELELFIFSLDDIYF